MITYSITLKGQKIDLTLEEAVEVYKSLRPIVESYKNSDNSKKTVYNG